MKHDEATPVVMSDNESEMELDKLIKTKSEMEVKFQEMQCKLTDQKMEMKARNFQDHIIVAIREYRLKLMDFYGTARTDERVVKARCEFEDERETVSQVGCTFRVAFRRPSSTELRSPFCLNKHWNSNLHASK